LVEKWAWYAPGDSIGLMVQPTQKVVDYKIARRINPEGVVLRLSPAKIEEVVTGAAEAVRLLTRSERSSASYSAAVVLDPGHGGGDRGVVFSEGVCEKDLVLDLAIRVRSVLSERYGIRSVLTREGDEDLSLLRRTEMANEAGGGLFVSLHLGRGRGGAGGRVDIYVNTPGRGAEKRVHRAVEEIGARYNEEPPGGVLPGDLRFVPWDGVAAAYVERSMAAARTLRGKLGALDGMGEGVIREGPIAVLRGMDMPALLLEVGSYSSDSPVGRSPLEDEEARARVARSLAGGIAAFFGRA
jgi:N-acetylmuramoyl-L-alanine amidase